MPGSYVVQVRRVDPEFLHGPLPRPAASARDCGTRAVDDSVQVALARGIAELLRNICRRLALDADNVIGPVFLGDGEIVGVAVESDNRRAAPKEPSVLDGIP